MNLQNLLEAAVDIALIGGDHTLNYFKKELAIDLKEDTSPVTIADKEAEQLMREQIQDRFPTHGILGEEFGSYQTDANIQWILDPIDGTKSFIHGIPLYTTLIGILVNGEPQVGIIYQPYQKEMCAAATGLGCFLNGNKISVRNCEQVSKATMLITEWKYFNEKGYLEGHNKLMEESRYHRTWGDAYGHMMVACGRADLMIDPILHLWDAAALHPIIREAGGWFGSVEGDERLVDKASGISCHPAIKQEVLGYFQ